MTIYKDLTTYPTENNVEWIDFWKIVKGLGRGWYIINIAISWGKNA